MRPLTKRWVEFAHADLEAAKTQLAHGGKRGSAYMVAVFHCHQAIEKILKANLVEQDKVVPKSHDLIQLRALTGLQRSPELDTFIDELQPHYILPRYPDFPFQPPFSFSYNKRNTEKIIAHTTKLFLWLKKQLP